MAAALAAKMLTDSAQLGQSESTGVRVLSAGTYAADGAPASLGAVQAMRERNIDLRGHHSQPLSPELLAEADEVYCMTASHRAAVLGIMPDADGKTELLDPAGRDIDDPFGDDLPVYRACAAQIQEKLEERLQQRA